MFALVFHDMKGHNVEMYFFLCGPLVVFRT